MKQGQSGLPDLSISIVLYNTEAFLADCLAWVRPLVLNGVAELIVVDNASPDQSAEIVGRELPLARVIHSPVNRGFAGGCNLAWPEVKGRYWLLLNPDTRITSGCLTELLSWMDAHPDVGVASPRLTDSLGNGYYFSLALPSVPRGLVETFRIQKLLPRRIRGRLMKVPELADGEIAYVDWVPGTAMMIRREVIEQVGLLSEDIFMYAEDVEWCWRAGTKGWRAVVHKGVTLRHVGGASSKTEREKELVARSLATSCYFVDQMIRGRTTATTLMFLRIINNVIECLHPLRTREQRKGARRSLRWQTAVLFGWKVAATTMPVRAQQ